MIFDELIDELPLPLPVEDFSIEAIIERSTSEDKDYKSNVSE